MKITLINKILIYIFINFLKSKFTLLKIHLIISSENFKEYVPIYKITNKLIIRCGKIYINDIKIPFIL